MNLINIFLTGFIFENIILTKFLGLCPFMGTTKKESSALWMGMAVTLVVLISSILTYLIYTYLLVPTNTIYLKTLIFILIIASLVQIMELLINHYIPKLSENLGIYLPLITTNCAVLGIILININNNYNLPQVIAYSLGSSLGFTMVSYVLALIREKTAKAPIINSFKGFPIALITAGIMALIFTRYIIK